MTKIRLAAAASAAVLGLALIGAGAAAQDGQPTLFIFESYNDAPFLAQYKEKHGAEPNSALFADEDEAFAKMRAGYTPDVMGPCSYEFPRWKEAGLLQPIDVSKISHWNSIPATLRNIPGNDAGDGKVWFVPQYFGNTSVTYRTDLAPEYVGNESWDILFDPKYKGRISALEGVDDTFAMIAKMSGVNPYEPLSAEDRDKVAAKLRELVAQSRFISSDETTVAQGLASGELVAAITWRISYATMKAEGLPVGYMEPAGGVFTYVCGLVIHKDSKMVDKAHDLIDSMIAPAAAKYVMEELGDGPSNTSVFADYTDEQMAELGLKRDVDAFLATGTFQQPIPNKDEIINMWEEIRAGL